METRPPALIACPDCAAVQELPPIRAGRLECWRCRGTLERATGRSLPAALACASTTLVLLFPANLLILLRLSVAGATAHSHLGSGVAIMWNNGYVLLAVVVALQAVLLPFARFGLLTAVLGALHLGREGAWIGPAFRWSEMLDLWAMPDVFLVGCFIGYGRIASRAPLQIGDGGWCFIGAALMTMLARATMDRRAIWRRIAAPVEPVSVAAETIGCTGCFLVLPAACDGQRCPRCRQRVWRRKPFAMSRAVALVAAGYALYPVANIYPLSSLIWAGGEMRHTIFAGVSQLVQAGLLPLACLIFTASIGIPLLKLVGMTWFFIATKQRSRRALVARTRLYRVIDEIGRWSNMDVYAVAVFLPLIQFGSLASVHVGVGAPAFLAVVVVTMLASRLFDPRLMWDAAGVTR